MPERRTTSNEVLQVVFDELKVHLMDIKNKVDQTNGRVKNLELWRQFLLGAWAVLTLITPIAWYLIYQSVDSFRVEIQQKIVDAIDNNNDKFFEQ